MNCSSLLRVAAVLAAATLPALAFPAASFAQASSTTAAPDTAASVSTKVEQHIKELHDKLGITPAEQPQWEQFAQVMRENAVQLTEAYKDRGTKVETMSAVDNMQSYAQLAQVHAANTQKLAAAFQTLYATFSDAQKQTADTVFQNAKGKHGPHKH